MVTFLVCTKHYAIHSVIFTNKVYACLLLQFCGIWLFQYYHWWLYHHL